MIWLSAWRTGRWGYPAFAGSLRW